MDTLGKPANIRRSTLDKFQFQVRLLVWKRRAELWKQKTEIAKIVIIPLLFFFLMMLIYAVITDTFAPDGIEEYIVPIAFWILTQKTVVNITYEKSNKLQEALRMMGLMDIAYWTSYLITDGIIIGFSVSFLCSLCALDNLFNSANFGSILGLLFVYTLSGTTFAFTIVSFFDTAQSAGQATILVMIGMYVIYLAAAIGTANHGTQGFMCLFPPVALQLGSGSFKKSYDGIPLKTICGIMVADIFIYSILAWYFSQVWPTSIGVSKPWYFPFQYHYWASIFEWNEKVRMNIDPSTMQSPLSDVEFGTPMDKAVPIEKVNEHLLGKPTIEIHKLKKVFGAQIAVNNVSLNMYENQIFALLGHNGAGKTTTINMLTGLIRPDMAGIGGAIIYGKSIEGDMDEIRQSMGVCPQHDVLFDNLSVREHILLASQLKGFSYQQANEEAVRLTNLFHLEKRLDHTGSELSGGQKRKLSVSLAICGGSRFIVLDEPTAGMDPLARRELWDLLASLRYGRTMLLTTHYMDEADILGDRVGIMSLGIIQCVGSSQFLKTTYGAGYKLIFDKSDSFTNESLHNLTSYVQKGIPGAKYDIVEGDEKQVQYILPFTSVQYFGPFFETIEQKLPELHVLNFGVSITSLEDVFLKVGEDHTVTPKGKLKEIGIGSNRTYSPYFSSQVVGIVYRKLNYAIHDYVSFALVGVPICCSVVVSGLYSAQTISDSNLVNDLISAGIYLAGYLGVSGLLAEFVVRERANKLRNVLTVMGCDFKAYWIGTFLADYFILLIPLFVMWITWGAAGMSDFYAGKRGLVFFIFLLFDCQLIAMSYTTSYMFNNPKSCIAFLPFFIVFLILLPIIVILLIILIFSIALNLFTLSSSVQAGIQLWGIMILSPHGALFSALLATTQNFDAYIDNYPPVGATIAFMAVEAIGYMYLAYWIDSNSIAMVNETIDPNFKPSVLDLLDEDVKEERQRALDNGPNDPLYIRALRKVFPAKTQNRAPLVAVEDIQFSVSNGEIFGLLGANGAGKTTALSMLTRHLIPTSGNAYIGGASILTNFALASKNLGVVTQVNSLWDLLSVEDHLYLFARLRGVPPDLVKDVVEGTIDQLELSPHRKKLALRLSGGMKRKLCVAIALIGDPQVVLLDEPSAGLDPVSRRNLWSVILKTMSHRSVILTTHSMEEAEALCARIAIMVKGQIRALGTKQHLKSKFSSGYELVVKLKVASSDVSAETFTNQVDKLTRFVTGLFSESNLISENGGLITYRIPKEQMNIGKSFTAFEKSKESLDVEDYSISQPTLEQVFIRTVLENSEKAAAVVTIGGGYRSSVDGLGIVDDLPVDGEEKINPSHKMLFNYNLSDFDKQYNICGCSNFQVKILILVSLLLFIIFALGSILGKVTALFALAIISLIISIVGCTLLCAPCCKKATGLDE